MKVKIITYLLLICSSSLSASFFFRHNKKKENISTHDLSIAVEVGWEMGIIDYKYSSKSREVSDAVLDFCSKEACNIKELLNSYVGINLHTTTSYQDLLTKVSTYFRKTKINFRLARAISYLEHEVLDITEQKRKNVTSDKLTKILQEGASSRANYVNNLLSSYEVYDSQIGFYILDAPNDLLRNLKAFSNTVRKPLGTINDQECAIYTSAIKEELAKKVIQNSSNSILSFSQQGTKQQVRDLLGLIFLGATTITFIVLIRKKLLRSS